MTLLVFATAVGLGILAAAPLLVRRPQQPRRALDEGPPPRPFRPCLAWEDLAVDSRDVHRDETSPAEHRARFEEADALRRVAMLVARQHEPEAVLALVTEEVAGHLRAGTAVTLRYDGPDRATVAASWTEPGIAPFNVGRHFEISPFPAPIATRA